jgi:hypothetical protein
MGRGIEAQTYPGSPGRPPLASHRYAGAAVLPAYSVPLREISTAQFSEPWLDENSSMANGEDLQ